MRVLVLASTFPRWAGDAQPTFILDLCRHLPDCELHVLAPGAAGAAASEVVAGIQVHRFCYAPHPAWQKLAYDGGMLGNVRQQPLLLLLLPFFLLAQVMAIRRLQRTHRFDLVHAHWVIPQGLCAALALAIAGAPKPRLLLTAHGADIHAFGGAVGTALKRIALHRADAVTAVSHALAQRIHVLGAAPEPVRVAPMGIDLSAPSCTAPRSGLCFVGRFVEKKGVLDLVDAYAIARARTKALPILTLAGDGPLRAQIEARIAQHGLQGCIHLAGWLARQQVTDLVAGSQFLVMPSRRADSGDQEGLGLVAVEALSMGTPVIAYDFEALADIKALGGGVMAVPEGNVEALAAALVAATRGDCSLRVDDGLRARTIETFSWPAVGHRYRTLYREITGA